MPECIGVGDYGDALRPVVENQIRKLLPAAHGPPNTPPPEHPAAHDGLGEHLTVLPAVRGGVTELHWRLAVKRFRLSPREAEVLRSIWTGRRFALAAEDVKISRHTLDTHWRRIRVKLQVNSVIEAVHKMYEVLISLQLQELREELEKRNERA